MADASKFPTSSALTIFQWETPDNPSPRLASGISATATTIRFTAPPKDHDGAIITGAFIFGCTSDEGYTESIYVPAGGLSADGLTATGCVRGVRPDGLDYTTGDTDFAVQHQAGNLVFCSIQGTLWYLLQGALQGTIATGSRVFKVGDETTGNIDFMYRDNVGNKYFLRKNTSTGKAQYSDNGVDFVNFSDSASSVLVKATATDTTPSYLNDKLSTTARLSKTTVNSGGDEEIQFDVVVDQIVDTAYGLEESGDKIRINIDSESLEFDAGEVQVKLKTGGGISKGADGLQVDSQTFVASIVAGEAITVSGNPVPAFISTGNSGAVIDSTIDPSGVNSTLIKIYTAQQSFQSFTVPTGTNAVKRFGFLLNKLGSPTGTLYAELFATDGSGNPTGSVLASDTIDEATELTGTATMTYFTFDISGLTEGGLYAVKLRATGGDSSNCSRVTPFTTSVYSGGVNRNSSNSGVTWGADQPDLDFIVECFAYQEAGKVYRTNKDITSLAYFDFFITETVASGANATCRFSGLVTCSGLTASSIYYAGSVGTISTSSSAIEVGKALTTTQLLINSY